LLKGIFSQAIYFLSIEMAALISLLENYSPIN